MRQHNADFADTLLKADTSRADFEDLTSPVAASMWCSMCLFLKTF